LAQRPAAFGLAQGEELALRIRVAVTVPDQDVSRLHAAVQAFDGAGLRQPALAQALVSQAVRTLLEPMRGFGGEASAASVELEVRCYLGV
jgi:hypothetical protein